MEREPGILISLRDQIMTRQMEVDFRRLGMTALQIVQTVQLTRFIVNDIQDVFQGDMVSLISLMTNILLLTARLKIVTETMIAGQKTLIAHKVLTEIAYRKLLVIT